MRLRRAALVALLAVGLVGAAALPAQAGWAPRKTFLGYINHARVERGLPALSSNWKLRVAADIHSARMASRGSIFHSDCGCGEIVGVGKRGGLRELFRAFMSSPVHRSVILSRDVRTAGVGYKGTTEFIWLTVQFR